MGRRIRGPTQLKRHLEKQKDLLEEAKRIILKELEWLQAEETILKGKLAELTQPPMDMVNPQHQDYQHHQQQQQEQATPVVVEADLMRGENLPQLDLSTRPVSSGATGEEVESEEED